MSDLFGNHIVGFPTRQLKCLPVKSMQYVLVVLMMAGWVCSAKELLSVHDLSETAFLCNVFC